MRRDFFHYTTGDTYCTVNPKHRTPPESGLNSGGVITT